MTDGGYTWIGWLAVAGCWVAAATGGCTFDESLLELRCQEAGAQRGQEVCRDGFWVERTDVSVGPDGTSECSEGEQRTTSRECGAADRGQWTEICRNGQWVNESCEGGWYPTCDELLSARPGAETGTHELDIDGPGGREPREYFCLMREHGWTLVAGDDFEEDALGWSAPVRSTCGNWGTILGGHCMFARGQVSRTFRIPPIRHTHAMLVLEYLKIDSWDRSADDRGMVALAGETIWSKRLSGDNGTQQCGLEDAFSKDQKIDVTGTVETGGVRSYRVAAGAALDEGACNESWGIDNVAILVR